MDTAASQRSQAVDDQSQRAPEEIRADIEETRREVGDTAAALAEKVDVKSRAKERIGDAKARFGAKRNETAERVKAATPESAGHAASTISAKARENPVALGIAGAAVAGFALGRRFGRR